MGAAAVVVLRERHIVEAMERLGITSPARARSIEDLETLGVDSGNLVWRALKDRVVVREAAPGLYYVDVAVWQASIRRRRHVLFILVSFLLLAAAVIFLTANRHPL